MLTFGFMMVAMSIPAVTLGIGRNEDLKVPWKAAIVVVTGLVGLAAGLSAPGWFFLGWGSDLNWIGALAPGI